jgi:hypothetical protein
MEKKIVVDFENILSELKLKEIKLCFLTTNMRTLCIEDSQENLYQMELYRHGSYLDQLIKDGTVVTFHQVEHSASQNIGKWQKEIWDISEVESFMKRQSIEVH